MVGTANRVDPSEPKDSVLTDALKDVVRAASHLRDVAVANFDKGDRRLVEVEDFWWQTRRFSDQLLKRLKAVP